MGGRLAGAPVKCLRIRAWPATPSMARRGPLFEDDGTPRHPAGATDRGRLCLCERDERFDRCLAHALIGYGLLQALVLLRLLPWIMRQPFSHSYWAFSFGLSALAAAPLRLMIRADAGVVATLAPFLFAAANIAIGLIVVGSLRLALHVPPAAIPVIQSSG
jgi:hypothetical protein